jgi:hypothetical protein
MSEPSRLVPPAEAEGALPTRWLTFYTYWGPVTALLHILGVLLASRFQEAAVWTVFVFAPLAVLAYGLRERRYWAYQLNVLLLVCDLAASIRFTMPTYRLVGLGIGLGFALAWVVPNYFYFKRRIHLFT